MATEPQMFIWQNTINFKQSRYTFIVVIDEYGNSEVSAQHGEPNSYFIPDLANTPHSSDQYILVVH